jgi:hypothetical protein
MVFLKKKVDMSTLDILLLNWINKADSISWNRSLIRVHGITFLALSAMLPHLDLWLCNWPLWIIDCHVILLGARVRPISNATYPTTGPSQGHNIPPPGVLHSGVNQTRTTVVQFSSASPPGPPHQMHAMQSVEPPGYHHVTAGPHNAGPWTPDVAYPPGHIPPPYDYKPPYAPPGWQLYN